MKYWFGNDRGVMIEAKTLEHAIKLFKAGELFPEKCVDKKFYVKNEKEAYDYDYDSDLERNIYKFKPGASIFIYDEENKKIGAITLEECINVDYRSLLPSTPLLEAPKAEQEEPETTLPVIGSEKAVSQMGTKVALREAHDTLMKKKADLERLTREINCSLNALKKELKQKQKVLYILELYMGIHEEIIEIKAGARVPE